MRIFIASSRDIQLGPESGCVIELEDVIAELCGAELLRPLCAHGPTWLPHRLRRISYSLPASQLERLPTTPQDVLFFAGINLCDLDILSALPEWRKRFRVAFAYIFDAFASTHSSQARLLDHIFVPMPQAAERITRETGVATSVIPMGCDVRKFGSGCTERRIDVVGYGRQYLPHSRAFEAAFNDPGSDRLFYHTTLRGPVVTNHASQRRQFWKILQKSEVALAYDVTTTGGSRFPYSFVAQRWFECLAAGCAVVGKRPKCAEADELLGWDDATIELPEEPGAAVRAVEELLGDRARLTRIHRRNYEEALARHDWSYRVADMFSQLRLDPRAGSPLLERCASNAATGNPA